MTLDIPNLKDFDKRLRDEAQQEPSLEIPQDPPRKHTQIIAIYGKGGIGKSFTLANLSCMMAEQGKRVLLIGCDPKSDTTSLLFGGKACPTIIETSTRKKLAGEEVAIGDVCFKRNGVFAMELGGPEVGRGCGGAALFTGLNCWKNLASTTGTSTMSCWISLAMWFAGGLACRLRATWRRRLFWWPLMTCNRCMWPITSVRLWNISARWAAMSVWQGWLSTRMTARAKLRLSQNR